MRLAVFLFALVLAASVYPVTFIVDSTVDAVPGDGICADASGACTPPPRSQELSGCCRGPARRAAVSSRHWGALSLRSVIWPTSSTQIAFLVTDSSGLLLASRDWEHK